MKPIGRKHPRRFLLAALVATGSLPVLAAGAPATQSFSVHGQAELFVGASHFTTPFVGMLEVNPDFVDPAFGIVGRVVSMNVRFPVLPEVPVFDRILTQGPEISGITPLKYDVTALNAKGEEVQFQFTTVNSPARFPGLGTPVGSLVDFTGGSFMQGSNTGPIDIGYRHQPAFLQNFHGQVMQSR